MNRLALLLLLALLPPVAACAPPEDPTPSPDADGIGFVDRAEQAGFTFENHTGKAARKDFIVEAKGGGALVLDYDGDGDMDIYVVDGNTYRVDGEGNVISRAGTPEAGNRLMRNNGDWTFTDVTGEAGLEDTSYGFGGAVGDYDNDGDPDIYVCNWGANRLFRNNGDGTFSDVTARAGVAGDDSYYSTCGAFFDADGDGDLDLYVSNYNDIGAFIRKRRGKGLTAKWRSMPVCEGPTGITAVPDRFYENKGDGTFADATATALLDQEARYAFTAVVSDFDQDGDLDLYVANDLCPNTLWLNDGTGHFTDRGEQALVAFDGAGNAQAGMGNDSADYDQDGRLDIFVTNFAYDTNTLYRNASEDPARLLFEDVTTRAGLVGIDFRKVCWGTKFQDLDHDGYLDLFVVAGHVYSLADRFVEQTGSSYRQLPTLWLSDGPPAWTFHPMTGEAAGTGLLIPKTGRGACFADFDNDGDIDIYVAALNDTPLLLENRLEKRGSWLMLDLVGKGRDRDAIGARATVIAGEIHQVQEKRLSASFICANDPRLHWGLGEAETVDRLEITWPGGARQVFENVPANRQYRLTEGGELETIR